MQNATICQFQTNESWVILSEIEQSIKRKIEAVGVPLKDWDINIYRGILTGYNEAFIISGEKKEEILNNCKTAEERARTIELIRPILRGRDIKRYSYDFADLWLINTHNGIKEKGIKPIIIDDYPAIKEHLDQFYPELEKRADKGITPYNLRNCAYMEEFSKQKIVWKAVGRNLTFSILEEDSFLTAPASFITSDHNYYILAFLSSSFGKFFIYQNSDTTGAGDIMLNIQSLEKMSIPKIKNKNTYQLDTLVDEIIKKKSKNKNIKSIEDKIDYIIFKLFRFTFDEIEIIKNI